MPCSFNDLPAESDIRFLEYRLDVISCWPASPRKQAAAEAISRRLASIARSTLCRPEIDGLLATSCRLLDGVFSAKPDERGVEENSAPHQAEDAWNN
jgi:hypothetical protein